MMTAATIKMTSSALDMDATYRAGGMATKRTPILPAARHTTSHSRRIAALRASVRTNQSGTLIPASIAIFAPLADTFVMMHGAIADP